MADGDPIAVDRYPILGSESYRDLGMDREPREAEDTGTQMHGGSRLPLGGSSSSRRPESCLPDPGLRLSRVAEYPGLT